MLNNAQIKLVQTAVRKAGLRTSRFEGRYRLLLGQYKQPDGEPVTSCKQLNGMQLEDLLAICESYGWRMPGKPENHYRSLRARRSAYLSSAQRMAIDHLRGDLGWNQSQLGGFLKRMTGGFVTNVVGLSAGQAYKVIEGLKAMVGRERGKEYKNLKEIQDDMEVPNGEGQTSQVG
ncbi:MAG: DUF1018 domain-containing protein [Planctomycetes bacterium]|nr:DUF1018 domain-containing protein [Planctomycetota bacterium]